MDRMENSNDCAFLFYPDHPAILFFFLIANCSMATQVLPAEIEARTQDGSSHIERA